MLPVIQAMVSAEIARPNVKVPDPAASGATAASDQGAPPPPIAEPVSLAPVPTNPSAEPEGEEEVVVLRLCDYCGSNCPPEAVFCPICGTALPAA